MIKRDLALIQFDIEDFYPSITMQLLYKSIQFAKEIMSDIRRKPSYNYAIKRN